MSDHIDLDTVRGEIEALQSINAQIAVLQDTAKTMRARIEDALGGHDTGTLDGQTVVTWTPIKSRRFDQSAFKKDHPQLAAEYVTVTESRRFQVVTP